MRIEWQEVSYQHYIATLFGGEKEAVKARVAVRFETPGLHLSRVGADRGLYIVGAWNSWIKLAGDRNHRLVWLEGTPIEQIKDEILTKDVRFSAYAFAQKYAKVKRKKGSTLLLGDLTSADVGRQVVYTVRPGVRESGGITSFNDQFVFVRFNRSSTAKACRYQDLVWADDGAIVDDKTGEPAPAADEYAPAVRRIPADHETAPKAFYFALTLEDSFGHQKTFKTEVKAHLVNTATLQALENAGGYFGQKPLRVADGSLVYCRVHNLQTDAWEWFEHIVGGRGAWVKSAGPMPF